MRSADRRRADEGTDPNPPAPILALPSIAADPPPSSTGYRVGALIAGKYRVERVLGVGGMGVVVAATHVELGELRAVKVMLPHVARSTAQIQRFRREARSAARLTSEHVTKVFDVGRLDDGTPYLVMEHLEGRDLRSHLEERGALPVAPAVAYVRQTCSALAEAHAAGLVHRDIKPANLFLARRADGSSRIKLLDFGIVKATSDTATTTGGSTVGSALYMAPEQWSGLDLDSRADVWALGVVLYELVTGRPPFSGTTWPHICALVSGAEPRPPSEVCPELPPELDAIVLRCLAKDRELRWQSVTDLSAALAPLDTLDTSSASPIAVEPSGVTASAPDQTLSVTADVPSPPLTWSLRGSLRGRRPLALAGALLLLAGLGLAASRGSQAPPSAGLPPAPAEHARLEATSAPPELPVAAPAAPARPLPTLPASTTGAAQPRQARATSPAPAPRPPRPPVRPAVAEAPPESDEFH